MRLFSSHSSCFKFLSRILVVLLLVTGCEKKSERTTTQRDATGKGNGGGTLSISQAEIDRIFSVLKPKLNIVFSGLALLTRAEKIVPGATDLSAAPNLQKTLFAMFGEDAKVSHDLQTEGNFARQEPPCRDFRGAPKAAAAVLLDVGGKICFSDSKIRSSTVRNFDKAAEIFIIALAAHEFVHHFISTGNSESDEAAAIEVQNFVEQSLIISLETGNNDTISLNDFGYITRFFQRASDIHSSATRHGLWR